VNFSGTLFAAALHGAASIDANQAPNAGFITPVVNAGHLQHVLQLAS
jgi:hypothetical protein